jgi:hypothetical protein
MLGKNRLKPCYSAEQKMKLMRQLTAVLAGDGAGHLAGTISTAEAKCDAFCAHGRLTTRIEARNCAEVDDGWSRVQTSSS